jgi:hypothetical protein
MADTPTRAEVKRALREVGLSDRQVKALLAAGWQGLVGARDAELAELRDAVEEMKLSFAHSSSAVDGA